MRPQRYPARAMLSHLWGGCNPPQSIESHRLRPPYKDAVVAVRGIALLQAIVIPSSRHHQTESSP